MHCAPDTLVAAVYEKTFLSENKLGELVLPLHSLCPDSPADDWYPLISEKSRGSGHGAWLVRLQLDVAFTILHLEPAPSLAEKPPNFGTTNTTSSSKKLASSSGLTLLGQEFF
jgi:hypothetical protein